MVVTFFVGVALAILYEKTRSLIAPIGAHALFNFVSLAQPVFNG
jgi:membrane protease YdiL (CAAX protease family)